MLSLSLCHADSIDPPESLTIHPFYPLLLAGLPINIQCQHTANVNKFLARQYVGGL